IIFDETGQHVLLTNLGDLGYGLPGGHIEEGELPDDAMNRELQEEAGLMNVRLRHFDFSWHDDGKFVLYYVGQISRDTPLIPQEEEVVSLDWTSIAHIRDGRLQSQVYKDAVLGAHQAIA